MEIPQEVEKIKRGAFENTQIGKVELPENLKEIGAYAFYKCEKLKELTLPQVEKLGDSMLRAAGVTRITIPQSVTSANGAMSGSKIEEVKLEEGTDKIVDGLFSGMEKLKKFEIPAGVTEIGEYAFQNSGLEEVEIPQEVEKIKRGAFENTQIGKVELPENLKEIGAYAFYKCSEISQITIPNKVKKLEYNTFLDCKELTMVNMSEALVEIDNKAFKGCNDNLYFVVKENTDGFYTLMDNGYKVSAIRGNSNLVNRDSSTYSLTKSRIIEGRYSTFIIEYELNQTYSKYKNVDLQIKVPSNMNYEKSIVYCDDKVVPENAYTYNKENGIITIPNIGKNGKYSVSFKAKSSGTVSTYARVLYGKPDNIQTDLIGYMSERTHTLSMSCSSSVSENSLRVTGYSSPGERINISVNNKEYKTVSSNKEGRYEVIVDTMKEGTNKIKAKLEEQPDCYCMRECKFEKDGNISVSKFEMYYKRNENVWLKKDLLDFQDNNKVSFNPEYGFVFKIGFLCKNGKKIRKVRVVSSKDGVKKYIDATLCDNGEYEAKGFFDTNNKKYIPGNLSVSYQIDDELFYSDPSEDTAELQEKRIRAIYDVLHDENSDIQYDDISVDSKCIKNSEDEKEIHSTIDGTTYVTKIKNEEVSYTKEELEKNGYIDINGTQSYYVKLNDSYDKCELDILQLKRNELKKESENEFDIEGHLENFNETIIITAIDECAVDALKTGVAKDLCGKVGILAPAVAAYDLGEDLCKNDYSAAEATWKISQAVGAFALGVALTTMLGPVSGLLVSFVVGEAFNYFADNVFKQEIEGKEFGFLIDPSGYVYEAVPSNRLKDVNATILYKKNMDSEEVKVWNASEYSQQNPIRTSDDGSYAWDVPEGVWQVKFEKEGFETAYSDWMEVPPERTGINIGMFSKENPQISNFSIFNDEIIIEFSQYMKLDNMQKIMLKNALDKEIPYSLNYTSEKNELGEELVKIIYLTYKEKQKEGDEIYIELPNERIKGYNKKEIVGNTKMKGVVVSRPEISVRNINVMKTNSQIELPIEILNYNDMCSIKASSSSDLGLSVAIKNFESGKGVLGLKADLPGEYLICIRLQGTDIEKKMNIKVSDDAKEEQQDNVSPEPTPSLVEPTAPSQLQNDLGSKKTRLLLSGKKIKVGKVKIKSAKNKKKQKLLLQWGKIKNAKGYQLQYAMNKKFKKKKSVQTKKTKYTIKKLKKKKTYYIRVRAYKMNGKKKVYGKWSTVKKVKIKK